MRLPTLEARAGALERRLDKNKSFIIVGAGCEGVLLEGRMFSDTARR